MWSYEPESLQSSISKQRSILFPKTNLNIQVIKGCQKTTGSHNQSLSRPRVLICLLALENWKRWAVTGTDLSLSLAERDDRGALRSTVSGGWMATQSFKNTERRYTISKHFYMRVCTEVWEISLNHFFLIFTCDSPFAISAAENGLIRRYTFKCSFSRSDGSFKRNTKAQSISVEHFINHKCKKHTFMNKVMAISHLTWKIEQSLNSEDRFFLISSTTIISGLAASPFSPDSIILL